MIAVNFEKMWRDEKEKTDALSSQLLAATERAKGLEKERDKWMNLECSDAVACPHKVHLEALTAGDDERTKMQSEVIGKLKQQLVVGLDDFNYIAEQCEAVALLPNVGRAEQRTWRVVGRLARQAGQKLK